MSNASASVADTFFNASLEDIDPEIFGSIRKELGRQRHEIELIASENIVSRAVLEAQGSINIQNPPQARLSPVSGRHDSENSASPARCPVPLPHGH